MINLALILFLFSTNTQISFQVITSKFIQSSFFLEDITFI